MIGSIYDLITLPGQVRNANLQKAIADGTIRIEKNQVGSPYLRAIGDGQSRGITEKESIERVILKAAKVNKGIITASDLALAANASIEESRKALDEMVTKGHAELRVRQSGSLVYVIPDLMDSDEPLVD